MRLTFPITLKRLAFLLSSLLFALGGQARYVYDLNFEWDFQDGSGNTRLINLPHDFQIEQPWVEPSLDECPDDNDGAANIKSRLSSRGFKEMGKGFYRKTLNLPDSLYDKRLLLDFGGIMLVGDVYLNGERIGGSDYGYLGFECDITNKVKIGSDNELMVVADTGEPLNSRWYTGGGLYRDVKLIVTETDLYLNRHGLNVIASDISERSALLTFIGDINAQVKDSIFFVEIEVVSPSGKPITHSRHPINIQPKWRNKEYTLTQELVKNPMLWDCENPNMYTAHVTLLRADGSIADAISQDFGIRNIEFSPEFGFKLNGKKVLLKGIANHHTLGALGAAAYPRAIEKRVQLLKEFGFNHIRCSHNPYSKEFLDICDRNGILVVDELYDKWLTQYAGGRKEWSSLWQDNIPEWIKRDRNHPSVIMWSLGNELQGYNNLPFNDWGVTAYRLQKTLLDKYDVSRPVTVAMHPRVRNLETDSLPAPLVHETDIAAYNYRYMYFPGDAKRFPNLIFYQSEANLSNMGPNFFVPDNDKVVGLAYWGMIDYLGESLGWPAKGWTDGVFDISLDPKPNAWFLKSMFVDFPVVKIGVGSPTGRLVDWNGIKIGGDVVDDSWNYQAGDTLQIYTYTNADDVALFLNGIEIGRQHNDVDNPLKRNRIVWTNIPYEAGHLEAIAYTEGEVVTKDRIETAGKPVKIIAEIDNPDWSADGMDLQHIRITAVDEKGRRVPNSDANLHFRVEGDAQLIAVSNGDNTSEELNVTNQRRLFKGRALAILRAGQSPSPITVNISSPLFPALSLSLATK